MKRRIYKCNGEGDHRMQLMTLNSLLMFDLVFLFFLFLVVVSCLVYYLPGSRGHAVTAAVSYEVIEAKPSPRTNAPIDDV